MIEWMDFAPAARMMLSLRPMFRKIRFQMIDDRPLFHFGIVTKAVGKLLLNKTRRHGEVAEWLKAAVC